MQQYGGTRVNKVGNKIQVVEEVPVYVEKEVEVPYEVIVERPVENIIENRYYVDKEIEVPIHKEVVVEVEVVKEQKKYIQVEKKVEIEKIVERPVEVIIDVPVEIIKEVPVPVERIVDKIMDRTILRPHRTEFIENQIIVEKPVNVDKIVERRVEYEVPIYIDKEYERIIEVPEEVYRDVPYEVPKVVEVKKEVEYERIIEVPVEKIVEKEIIVDKIVEIPYEVEKIIERKREVPYEKIVEKPVYVDKIVEIPVEKRVEVPYTIQKYVEKIIHRNIDVPVIVTRDIEVPIERIIEEPVEVIEEIQVPVERIVERIVEVPVYKEKEIYEDIEIEVPVEKIVEVPVYVDKEVEVEIIKEKFVEVPIQKIVDKIVEVERIVEKPVYNQKIVEIPIEKIVERRVEVPVEKYVEVPKYVEVEKIIEVEKRIQIPRVIERKSVKKLKKSHKRSNVSRTQKATFTSLGESINRYKIDNIKLSLEIKSLQQQITEYTKITKNPNLLRSQNAELREKIRIMEQNLSKMRSDNIQLESQTTTTMTTQVVDVYSRAEIQKLEADVSALEQKNQRLRAILAKIGVSTTNITTGHIKTEEIREVDHYKSTVHVPLSSMTQTEIDDGRHVSRQEKSMKQTPTDITGVMHISQLKKTSYREREDPNQDRFGKKNVDESNIVKRISTYQRGPQNKETRTFGGVEKQKISMQYHTKVQYPEETHTESYVQGNKYVTRTETTSGYKEVKDYQQNQNSQLRDSGVKYTTTTHTYNKPVTQKGSYTKTYESTTKRYNQ